MTCDTVQYTVQHKLCCGCGVCKGICPKACIAWGKKDGFYQPCIDEHVCVNCGLCAAVCPGLGHSYTGKGTAVETVTGVVLACCNAWSKDRELRHVSASGGVVSTLIRELLSQGRYDSVFCLDTYDYRQQLRTRRYTTETFLVGRDNTATPKSRYLPVSHEEAISYMKENRHERIILVATSCALRGITAAIESLSLPRENYLLIGLFCDKVFHYHVLSYFENTYAAGKTLEALHFKNKESGGWPGDMKLFPVEGEPFYVPLSERAKAKAYFMPERCLYCVDKLNVCADISLGDNYTGRDDLPLGSNSVIIRTQAGLHAWKAAKPLLEIRDIGMEDIQRAQYLEGRLNHLYFGALKSERDDMGDLNQGVPLEEDYKEFERAWFAALQRLRSGAVYDSDSRKLEAQMAKDERKPDPLVHFIKRCYRFAKRTIRGLRG